MDEEERPSQRRRVGRQLTSFFTPIAAPNPALLRTPRTIAMEPEPSSNSLGALRLQPVPQATEWPTRVYSWCKTKPEYKWVKYVGNACIPPRVACLGCGKAFAGHTQRIRAHLLNLSGRDVTTCTRTLRNFVGVQRQEILSLDEAYINAQRVRNVRLHVS